MNLFRAFNSNSHEIPFSNSVRSNKMTINSISVQCNAGTFYSLFLRVMILPNPKLKICFRKKIKRVQKTITSNLNRFSFNLTEFDKGIP